MVNRKQLSFAAEVNSDLPHLLSDSTKLKQVLLNLLSNAIKFTREGGILLSVERLDLEHVRFCVADTGIGIKSEHLHEIFEHFRQLDQTHTREYGGTGLGLTITQNLLVLLGGTISVESTYGSGSRFIVELPCQFSAARRTSDAGLRTSGGSSDVSMST
jgi:signal transduction histidine kinase